MRTADSRTHESANHARTLPEMKIALILAELVDGVLPAVKHVDSNQLLVTFSEPVPVSSIIATIFTLSDCSATTYSEPGWKHASSG